MLEMRTSERNSLKRCAQQWYWSTVEGLAPIRAATPLWFGSAIHDALAQWYGIGSKRGENPATYFEREIEESRQTLVIDENDELTYVDAVKMGIDMLERYVKEYGRDDNWDVLAIESKFQVRLARPDITLFGIHFDKVPNWLRYVGTWDGVYRDKKTGEIWLMEHKTAAGIRIDHLPLDDQAGSYWAFATVVLRKRGILGPKEHIAGIMYNFLRKAVDDTRPQDEKGQYHNQPQKKHYVEALIDHFGQDSAPGEIEEWEKDLPKMTIPALEELAQVQGITVLGDVSKSQPPPYLERFPVYRSVGERATMIRRIQDEAIFAEAYREGWLPITKTTSKDCSWCPFNRMCQLHEQGDLEAVEEFKESQYIVRYPYEFHKKSAEGGM